MPGQATLKTETEWGYQRPPSPTEAVGCQKSSTVGAEMRKSGIYKLLKWIIWFFLKFKTKQTGAINLEFDAMRQIVQYLPTVFSLLFRVHIFCADWRKVAETMNEFFLSSASTSGYNLRKHISELLWDDKTVKKYFSDHFKRAYNRLFYLLNS